jgi:hypothetical protein
MKTELANPTVFLKHWRNNYKQASCLLLAVRRPSAVASLTHGGELKNREAPVLNMTSIGICHHKKITGENTDFRSFWILGCQIRGPTLPYNRKPLLSAYNWGLESQILVE